MFKHYGHLSRWKIVDLVHSLHEWRDPDGGAIPIDYDDILRAYKKRPEEIAAIMDELASLDRIDALCATR